MDIKPTKMRWRNIMSDKLVNSGIIADYFKANQFRYMIYVISYWKVILSLAIYVCCHFILYQEQHKPCHSPDIVFIIIQYDDNSICLIFIFRFVANLCIR